MTAPRSRRRDASRRRAIRLELLTIAWNAVEVFVTIGLGIAAGSLALVAFGLDSVIEIWASSVVVWHVSRPQGSAAHTTRALRLVATAFVLLGVVLLVTSALRLASGAEPDESPLGIVYLAATVVVMLVLARLKRRVGADLGDNPLSAEARMTFLDGLLASAILVALVVNALAGWWWADPLAAALVGVLAFGEGRENYAEASEISQRAG